MGLFKKPEETRAGLKVLGYGKTGSGKTLFALTFPKIVAIDSEAGMQFYKSKTPNLLYHLPTTSAEEVEEGLEEIEDELMGEVESFVLDSETKINENLKHSALNLVERRAKKKGQDVQDAGLSQREYGKIGLINKRIQATKIKLSSMGVNVVSIAQEKDIKEKKGDDWVTVGYAPDTAKGFEYDYDLVLRFFTKEDKDGTKYFAEVIKDRTQTYKKGDVIENATYDNWKHIVDNTRDCKTQVVDFKKDIKKDEDVLEAEIEKLEEIVSQIKDFVDEHKNGDKSKLTALLKKTKEYELSSPTKVKDIEQAQVLLELCK